MGNAGYIDGLKQRFPAVPQALFAASDTQAGPGARAAVISPTGTLFPAEDSIDFDREFRGLLDEPQIFTEFVSPREKSREQPALAHSQLQSITGTVRKIQTNHQQLISKLAELDDELDSQRQATAQAYIARHALVSELAGLRDKVIALTDVLEEIRTNQQIPDSKLADLREELTTQGDAARRVDSHITAIQSELASIHAQVSELHSAQQTLLGEATESQEQLNKTHTATQTQLQSIEQSLQELQTGRQELTSELTKLGEELKNQGQTLAAANTARDSLAAELASKQSVDEITVAQQQFKEQQAAARQQLESMEQSLQELQTGRQDLTSELNKLSQEFDGQRQANTQSDAARKALIDELATIRSQATIADEAMKSEQARRQKLDSELVALQQRIAGQAESFTKSGSEIAAMRIELASINDQVKILREVEQDTVDKTAQSQEKLKQELSLVRAELEKQRQLFAQSDTDRRKLVAEVADVRKKLGALGEGEQVARAGRNQLNAELYALRREVAANTDANLRLSQQSAKTDVEIAFKKSVTVGEGDRASPDADERPELQVAGIRSPDEQEPATAPHAPIPRTQAGPSGRWKITPISEGSDEQFTHRASGTITRLPSRVTITDTPSGPNTTEQLASVTNLSNITTLNTLSDFDAIDPFLQAWTEDWERKSLNLAKWRDQRRNSLLKTTFIDVKLNNIQQRSTGASSAQLTFNQTYRSNIYSDQVVKTLVLRWEDERWKIVKEESRSNN
jgi:predicted  nucleic acid-binding Zn-ribbon protein